MRAPAETRTGGFDPEHWPEGWDAHEPPEPAEESAVEPVAAVRQLESAASLTQLAPFPTQVLPPVFRHMVRAVAANKQVPEELPAFIGLAAVATLTARYLEIARGSGWVEPLNIYAIVSMESGTGKTPAEKDVMRAVWGIEKRLRAEYAATLDVEIDALDVERGAVANKGPAAANRIEDQIKALEESKKSPPDLIFGSDTSIEMISDMMSRTGGAGSIIDSEGEFFGILSGRYSGGVPNIGIALKGYDGDRYKVRRIGRKQEDLERAVLTLGLCVQPVILEDAAKSKAMVERGLLARFLFAVPPSLLGTRDDEGAPYDIDAMRAWREAVEDLHEFASKLEPDGQGDLPLLVLTARARAQHVRFCGWIERRLHPDDGDLGNMPGWAAKHKARALRLAGLLHLIGGGRLVDEVSEQTMLASIEICRWAVGHAVAVFQAGGILQEEESRCADVIAWLHKKRPEKFTTREAIRGIRKKWLTDGGVLALADVLNRLCEDGHLTSTPEKNRAGHQVTSYRPHPLLMAGVGEAA